MGILMPYWRFATLNIRLFVRMFFCFYFSTYAASIFSYQESSFVFHHIIENNCTISSTSSVVFLTVLSTLLQEEEALIAAHRKEIEDTMEIVREVSKNFQSLITSTCS